MDERHKKIIITVLYILLPLTAFIGLGVSSYLWYRFLKPEAVKIKTYIPLRISPEAFSSGFKENLSVALSEYGIEKENIYISDADPSLRDIQKVYNVKVPENTSLTLLNAGIHEIVHEMGGDVFQGVESSDGKTLTIKVGVAGIPTDVIILKRISGIKAAKAKMAIIVDDLGFRKVDLAERLCRLKQVVTLAILPFQHHTEDIIDIAVETETPYMLHMPMEPKSSNSDPGTGAIYVKDAESTILDKLEKAFKNVRGAQGLNNHMGSKATEDVRIMEIVMKYLNDNNYFFVDSQTSRKSRAYSLSQKLGVKSAILYSYIDVEDDKAFITRRLDDLAEAAFEKGIIVTICHDRPNTVDVLEKKLPELEERGIKFVKITDIVR